MTVTVTPHINSRGKAREQLEFYRTVFGGETTFATYSDIHAALTAEQGNDIAFGALQAPNGFRIMAYDVQPSKAYDAGANPFYLVLVGTDRDEVQRQWDGLAAGGEVLVPIGPAAFSPFYGMVTDRFGVTWIVEAQTGQPA